LIGDTGIHSATRGPVGEVRRRWQARPAYYERLFDQVGALVIRVREALAQGDIQALGLLLDQNHALLKQIGGLSPELDRLVSAARDSGSLGAKLSGAGWCGVMFALVSEQMRAPVAAALAAAGATRVLETTIELHAPASAPEPL
jgi:mevalonate kinase